MGGGLTDGAVLAGIGIAVVFITLIVLMAVMVLLGRGFRDKGKEPMPTAGGTVSIVSEEGEGPPDEVVAAIALAWSLAQSEPGHPVPKEAARRERESSRWAASGRQQLMDSRGRMRKRW